MTAPVVELVQRFRGERPVRAMVLGDAMVDRYLEGRAVRLCTEGPVPVVRHTREEQVPGGAANSAANLHALGAQVSFLGLVGSDAAGAQLRSTLHHWGVGTQGLVEDPGVQTVSKVRIVADDQYVVRFDAGETRTASPTAHTRLLAELDALYPECDLVLVSDYGYGVMSGPLRSRLAQLHRERPVPLVVDAKELGRYRQVRATLVTPTLLEAQRLVTPGAAEEEAMELGEVERLGRRVLEEAASEGVAITLGGEGVLLVERGREGVHVPAQPVAQAQDVGAGDTFAAAVGMTLAVGGSAVAAVRIGVAAAGIAVSRRRTAIVRRHELLGRVSLEDVPHAPSLADLLDRLHEERAEGNRIVFTNGVFDLLHAGHIHFLRAAKGLGEVLVVGVNGDASAGRLKGPGRPVMRERDRVALVAALGPVDYVIPFAEDTPDTLIRAIKPDVHVKGGDYAGATLPESEVVHEVGGQVVILPLVGQLSTSSLIDRIVAQVLGDTSMAAMTPERVRGRA